MNLFPVSRCASATKIVCPLESTVATQPQLQPALLRLSAITSQNFTLKRIVLLLVSTQQSQNDRKGRNDAGDNIRHCRDCGSLLYPAKYLSARDCAPGPNT